MSEESPVTPIVFSSCMCNWQVLLKALPRESTSCAEDQQDAFVGESDIALVDSQSNRVSAVADKINVHTVIVSPSVSMTGLSVAVPSLVLHGRYRFALSIRLKSADRLKPLNRLKASKTNKPRQSPRHHRTTTKPLAQSLLAHFCFVLFSLLFSCFALLRFVALCWEVDSVLLCEPSNEELRLAASASSRVLQAVPRSKAATVLWELKLLQCFSPKRSIGFLRLK